MLFIKCMKQIDGKRLWVRLYLEVIVGIDEDKNFRLLADIDVSVLFDTADVETFYLLVFSPLGEARNIGEVFERELSVFLLVGREESFVVGSADYNVVVGILRGVGDFLSVESSVKHSDFGFASDSPTCRRAVGKRSRDDCVLADEHSVHVWSPVTLATVPSCVRLHGETDYRPFESAELHRSRRRAELFCGQYSIDIGYPVGIVNRISVRHSLPPFALLASVSVGA